MVALSGGVDSVALLVALRDLPPALPLRAVHVNHHLNPNASLWERHCRRLCRGLGVPLAVRHAAIDGQRGESLEALAREARYRLLATALRPGDLLVTAHHLDDQFETVLLQLLRGSGAAGLAAMPGLARLGAGWLGRPLLDVPRASLEDWARASGVQWVDDDSNADPRFDRNYLRHRVLPVLRERWPAAARTVARGAAHVGEALEVLAEVASRDLAGLRRGSAVDGRALAALPPARQRLVLRAWLAEQGAATPDAATLERIRCLTDAVRADAAPMLRWPGGELRRYRGCLYAGPPAAASAAATVTSWPWRRRRRLPLGDGLGVLVLRRDPRGALDAARLPESLCVRFRAGGERIVDRAGGPRRTLKEMMRSAGVLPWMRSRVPLVCVGERLVAVPGVCVAGDFAANESSRARLTLEWLDAPPWRERPAGAEIGAA